MQTFDQALFNLYKQGVISYDVALSHADSTNDLRLMIKLNEETHGKSKTASVKDDSMPSFTLQEEDDNMNLGGVADVKNM
jgi:twitching motility protein PilU